MELSPLQLRSDLRVLISCLTQSPEEKKNKRLTSFCVWGNGLSCFWMALPLRLPLLACRTKAVAVTPCQEEASLSMSAQAWAMTLPYGPHPPILRAERVGWQVSHTGPGGHMHHHHHHHHLPLLLQNICEGDPHLHLNECVTTGPEWRWGPPDGVSSILLANKVGHPQPSIFSIIP